MLYTLFLYNSVLLIASIFAYFGEKSDRYNSFFIFSSFCVLFVLSFIRFDVGHDYWNYYNSFKLINSPRFFVFSSELSYSLFCKLFSFSPRGYVYVFGLYSFLTLFFLYKTLIYYKSLFFGVFIFIAYNMLFTSFDQIRQTLAIFIFLYSIRFIENKSFKKYLIFILLATFFHFSAIILLPVYFLSKIKINFWIWPLVFMFLLVGYFNGTWTDSREYFFSMIPYYNSYALLTDQLESKQLSSGLGLLYQLLITIIILWQLKNRNYNHLFLFSAFGLVVFLFSSGNLNLDRIANYFLFANVISIPLVIKNSKILKSFFLITGILIFQLYIIKSPRGTSPYQTIFSNNFKKEIFIDK